MFIDLGTKTGKGTPPPPEQSLREQLRVLRAVRLANPSMQSQVTLLLTCPMTQAVMAELSQLPEWGGHIDMRDCSWPLPHEQYSALATHLPLSYTSWHVDGPQSLCDALCVGLNETRKQVQEPIALHVKSAIWSATRKVGLVSVVAEVRKGA